MEYLSNMKENHPPAVKIKLRQDTPLQNAENTGEYGFLTIYDVKNALFSYNCIE